MDYEIVIDKEGNEYIVFNHGNGEYSGMLKSTYDEQQAAMPKQEWVEPQLTK